MSSGCSKSSGELSDQGDPVFDNAYTYAPTTTTTASSSSSCGTFFSRLTKREYKNSTKMNSAINTYNSKTDEGVTVSIYAVTGDRTGLNSQIQQARHAAFVHAVGVDPRYSAFHKMVISSSVNQRDVEGRVRQWLKDQVKSTQTQ